MEASNGIDHVEEKISTNVPEHRPARPLPNLSKADFALRLLLLATSLTGIVVMATSKQTVLVAVPMLPNVVVSREAKFNYSPAYIYCLVALSTALFYSIITLLASFFAISNHLPSTKSLLLLACSDSVMGGVMASAAGAAIAVAYVGKTGESHAGWRKICGVFDRFCNHAGGSALMALTASVALVLLVMLSTYSLYRRSH